MTSLLVLEMLLVRYIPIRIQQFKNKQVNK